MYMLEVFIIQQTLTTMLVHCITTCCIAAVIHLAVHCIATCCIAAVINLAVQYIQNVYALCMNMCVAEN